MKVLFKKLKRSHKGVLWLFYITLFIYIISLGCFSVSIFSLTGIETLLRIIGFILILVWLVTYTLISLTRLIKKKNKTVVIISIITLLVSGVFFVGSHYINYFYGKIGGLTDSDRVRYTSYLISLKDTEFSSSSKIGMINDEKEIEGNILAKKLINKYKLKNEVVDYEDYDVMINDMYDKNIDAIFVSSNYKTLFANDDEESQTDIGEDTKIIHEFSEERKNEDLNLVNDKSLDEPFTALIMGVDSAKDGLNANAAFNGDTLILATFNPKTLTATMFSIPRDTFVPIACRNGSYYKINSSAAYGTGCVIDTIEQFTDINIDYYVKVNFKGVVDLVEAVGGVTVDVEKPDFTYNRKHNCGDKVCEQNSDRKWKENTVYVPVGKHKLNGEQALAYSRNRHQYRISDLARNKHQQDVISALSQELLKIDSMKKVEKILDAISNNIATNMSTKQILSSYEIFKDMLSKSIHGDEMINIKRTYLQVYSLPVNMGNRVTSALGYYSGSLEEIKNLMKENLELKEKDPIKTFSYSINEDYTSKVYGKGITTGKGLELLPNFVGKNVSEVKTWASSNGITLNVTGTGNTVVTQSPAKGYLLTNVKSLTIDTTPVIVHDPKVEDTVDNSTENSTEELEN